MIMIRRYLKYLVFVFIAVVFSGCGIGGYHMSIYKYSFPYSGVFKNSEGLNLAYKIHHPYKKYRDSTKLPLFLYIDGSGPYPVDMTRDNILTYFQSKGFVAATKQKRGVDPSEGTFSELTFKERIQDNLDFISYLFISYPEIDSEQVYIMGYSEGATVAGAVVHRYKKAAGLIWLSACLNEDWYSYISSVHPKSDQKTIDELHDGTYEGKKWQYYSKQWWHQHFSHKHYPELMGLPCPILFLFGENDREYQPFKKRYDSMINEGKQNISLYIIPAVGHETIISANQAALFTVIDKWMASASQ